MEIQERIVSSQRHTIGYVINGQEYTRLQAIKMAHKINNARVVDNGNHLIGDGISLSSLPWRFGKARHFNKKRR